MSITFTRRQVALLLSIVMQGESLKRLAKTTMTAAAELRLIASNELDPTKGVLSFLDLRRHGKEFICEI
jgi:hypothetical protein